MPYVRRRNYRTTRRVRRSTAKAPRAARRARRTRRTYKSRAIGPKWPVPLASTALRKFKYNDTGFSGSTTAPIYMSTYVFRGNSLYDPDYTGVGVQPYGYDQTTTLFQVFRVAGSKIRIHVRPNDQNPGAIKAAVFSSSIGTILPTDLADIMQRPGTKCTSFTFTDPTTKMKLVSYKSTRWEYPEVSPRDAGFNHAYNANPTYGWYWYITFDSFDANVARDITFDVQITYYAVCRQSTGLVDES